MHKVYQYFYALINRHDFLLCRSIGELSQTICYGVLIIDKLILCFMFTLQFIVRDESENTVFACASDIFNTP